MCDVSGLQAFIALCEVKLEDNVTARHLADLYRWVECGLVGKGRGIRRVAPSCICYPESRPDMVEISQKAEILVVVVGVADAAYARTHLSPGFFRVAALNGQEVGYEVA